MAWVFLFIASVMEVGWMYSLKFIDFAALKRFSFTVEFITVALPLIGYILFGLANIYFFSLALKTIPTATAFAIWTVTALAGIKLIDIWFFKEPSKISDYFFLLLAIISIVGLKKN